MLSKEILKELGEEGFIVAPGESEEAFVRRVDSLRLFAKEPEKFLQIGTYESWKEEESRILGAKPDWIPWTYSNKRLLPWQGAVMWLFEGEGDEEFPIIQLRREFKKGRYLFYSREEVLWHEALHAIRMGYKEPRFEEILAYYHSSSKVRKFFGPLFRTPSQALIFLSLILLSIGLQVSSLFFLTPSLLPLMKGALLLPLLDLTLRSARLMRDQRILKKALKKLSEIFSNHQEVFPIAIRLKDVEIESFAMDPTEKILKEIEEKIPHSLRWRQILAQFC